MTDSGEIAPYRLYGLPGADRMHAVAVIQAAAGCSSKHQAVILAIHQAAERMALRSEVGTYAEELATEYGDVLDRLAGT